jgi:hypothetical protein
MKNQSGEDHKENKVCCDLNEIREENIVEDCCKGN